MSSIDIFDSHEKDLAWTEIFKLTDRAATGNFRYYHGLTFPERENLLSFFQTILEDSRRDLLADRLGSPDTEPTERPQAEPPALPSKVDFRDLYNPANYSFGEGKLWIPWAEDATSGAKRGRYPQGYPRGLVLHWTAGHRNGLKAGNQLMRDTGMLYLLGDKDGNLAQSDTLASHGYHAGKSSHRFASGYVSDEYIGLELQAAGMLTLRAGKFYSWFNTVLPKEEVVTSGRRENIAPGSYHIYTVEQMILARKLCAWLYLNNPAVFSISRVVGHDEVSPGRKVDPGGSCIAVENGKVITMTELRRIIENDIDVITEARKRAA